MTELLDVREESRPGPQVSPRPEGARGATAKPRKVMMFVSHYPAGGAQEIIADIGHGLVAKNAQIKLLALYPAGKAPVAGETDWGCVVPNKPKSVFDLVRLPLTLLRQIREFSPDAVISALPAANLAAIFGAAVAAPRARVIITHHSAVQTHNKLFNALDSWLGGWRNVFRIVSVSDAVRHSLQDKPAGYRAKCATIRNALPPRIEDALAELVAKRDDSAAPPRTVVATGRLSRQKNYPALLRAARHLPDVQILIIGGGEDEQALKALAAELGVEDRVQFLGRKPREETLALLANAGVFAQPSLFEGHSLALVEAAKLHLPLVVSNVPEQVEAVTLADGLQCGMLVDPADDVALAKAIRDTLDDPAAYKSWRDKAKLLAESLRYDDMIAAYDMLLSAQYQT
ncbi:glycosyltransferase [Rhodoblastus sp.]|uniref:glycosyltransferase n=1 Tax=Rhodoblastus sp. TaxID=1962975 RepID=UPI0035B0163D